MLPRVACTEFAQLFDTLRQLELIHPLHLLHGFPSRIGTNESPPISHFI
jgi:hypothetical protein